MIGSKHEGGHWQDEYFIVREELAFWKNRSHDLERELRRQVELNVSADGSGWNSVTFIVPAVVKRAQANTERRNRVANLCFDAIKGKCRLGDYCPHSHDLIPFPYCREYNETGTCRFPNCKYIHSLYDYQLPHALGPEHVETMKRNMFKFSMAREPARRGYSEDSKHAPSTTHRSRSRSRSPTRAVHPRISPVTRQNNSDYANRYGYGSENGYGLNHDDGQYERTPRNDRFEPCATRHVFNPAGSTKPRSPPRLGDRFNADLPPQPPHTQQHTQRFGARSHSRSRDRGISATFHAPTALPQPPPSQSAPTDGKSVGGVAPVGSKRKKHYLE